MFIDFLHLLAEVTADQIEAGFCCDKKESFSNPPAGIDADICCCIPQKLYGFLSRDTAAKAEFGPAGSSGDVAEELAARLGRHKAWMEEFDITSSEFGHINVTASSSYVARTLSAVLASGVKRAQKATEVLALSGKSRVSLQSGKTAKPFLTQTANWDDRRYFQKMLARRENARVFLKHYDAAPMSYPEVQDHFGESSDELDMFLALMADAELDEQFFIRGQDSEGNAVFLFSRMRNASLELARRLESAEPSLSADTEKRIAAVLDSLRISECGAESKVDGKPGYRPWSAEYALTTLRQLVLLVRESFLTPSRLEADVLRSAKRLEVARNFRRFYNHPR